MLFENREVKYVKGVGEKTAQLLNKLGIFTLDALLNFYPKSYIDLSDITKICDASFFKDVAIKAKITSEISEHHVRKNMVLYKFTIFDKTGACEVTLFNNKFLAESLKQDEEYIFYGKLNLVGNRFVKMNSPLIVKPDDAVITPIYHLTKGLYNKTLIRIIKSALTYLENKEFIPLEILKKYKLISHKQAIENIHFPKSQMHLKQARRRLIFEELFLLKTGQLMLKAKNRIAKTEPILNADLSGFYASLPFNLTDSQQNAILECLSDMQKETPMNRLLQGDVGCGKTAVAAALIYATKQSGKQSVLMAPTGILAFQHYKTLQKMLPTLNIALLLGNTRKKEKEQIKLGFKNKEIDLIIGTHAVITEKAEITGASLVITDEQHRFGVKQRATLGTKAGNPHTLYMSATPIPRTLGLVIYGELDISVITALPNGRKPIKSMLIDASKRERAFNFIKEHLLAGEQAYIVCPLVEEGETELVSALEYSKKISENEFSDFKVGVLHGKMKQAEKERVMQSFLNGEIQILVATTIVEVGVDVPNSTIMLIENAERFGLSTLHQLRGRIGRGNKDSYFIMLSDFDSERLNIMCNNRDGFKIAEEDLRLRGPGDFLGQRQHGLPELKMANLIDDSIVMKIAGDEAENMLKKDPQLKANPLLKHKVLRLFYDLDLDI